MNGDRGNKVTLKFGHGDIYIGDLVGITREGKGFYKWKKSGNVYEGSWSNGYKHGFGTFTWKEDGSKWVGIWNKDSRYKGIEYDKKGKILKQGIWKNGDFKSEKVNLKSLKSSNNSIQETDINHDICLKAADYKGCMKYQNR